MVTGLLFPDVNEYHPVTDFAKASKAGIIGYRGRDDSSDGSPHVDDRGRFHYNGFKGRGLVELIYTVENSVSGAEAYRRLRASFPWRPGIIYVADVESGGLSVAQAKAFVKAAHADGKPGGIYGLASSMFDAADVKWIAKYSLPQPARADVWQFNGGAPGLDPETFPGVAGNCDMNKLIMPVAALKKMSGLEGEDMADVSAFLDGVKSILGSDVSDFMVGTRAAKYWSRYPSAEEIAQAVVAALPPCDGGSPIDDATIAKVAKAVVDELTARLAS